MRRATVAVFPVLTHLLLIAPHLAAQMGPMRVTVPSPTAASLGRFGDIPVNLFTGIPDISIPLFLAKGRTLELPIVLRYHASGIRVEDIGGWAGLGWALEAGGTITRTVRGNADESTEGYWNTGNAYYDNANWPPTTVAMMENVKDGLVDSEPDQFFFSFAGQSGRFVAGPIDLAGTIEYRVIPHQKIRIEPFYNPGLAWVITTEDGTRYTFGAVETTIDYSTNSLLLRHPGQGEDHLSSWHLTEIHAPGGDVITLHYSSYAVRHKMGWQRELFHLDQHACVPSALDVWNEYQIMGKRLDSITTAAHTVRFVAGLRADALHPSTGAQQEPRLDRIVVATPTGTVLRQFQFEHDYFAGNRLRLKNVFEQDAAGVPLPPYSFTYNTQSLPPRTSNALDHWGYFNGKTTNPTPIPQEIYGGVLYPGGDRSPSENDMAVGMLSRVTYPTGGYAEFVFEPHNYGVYAGGGTLIGDGPLQTTQVESGPFEGLVSTDFTVGGVESVIARVWVMQDPSGCDPLQRHPPCPYTELVGKGKWTDADAIYDIVLGPGTYTLKATEANSGGNAWIRVTWRNREPVGSSGGMTALTAGGLRVAEVRVADAMGNVTVRRYQYVLESDPTVSSGVLAVKPAYAFWFEYTGLDPCSYLSRSSVSRMPLGEGPVVGYREVVELRGSTGEHGKTRYTFRGYLEAPDDPPPAGTWPFLRRTSQEWQRGQQMTQRDNTSAGAVQQRTSSVYEYRQDPSTNPQTVRRFRGLAIYTFPGGSGTGVWNPFEVIVGWTFLASDTTLVADESGGSSFSTARTFTYGATHGQLTELRETNSNGTERITRMKYPADYATGSSNLEAAALTAMQGSAHTHSAVIERWVAQKVGPTETVLQATLTSFRQDTAGHYSPYETFVFNNASGVTNFAPSSVTSGSFTKDSRYLRQERAHAYDSWGRVVTLLDPRDKTTTYVYGGNGNKAFLTKVTRAHDASGANLVTDIAYNGNGYVSSIKDEGGTFRYFTYDVYGRLRQIKNHPDTVVRAYGYVYSRTAANGWTFQTSNPNAVVDTTFLVQGASPKRLVSTEYVDGLGRPAQTAVQDGTSYHVTAIQYDIMGRVWRTWRPFTRTTAGYDASFTTNATSFYNTYHATSSAKPYVETTYTPDALSRVKQITPEYIGTSASALVVHAYGTDATPKHQFTEITDESGKKTRTFTDIFGNPVRTILGYGSAEATNTVHTFDVLGQRTQTTDPRGLITTYTWNTRGLLTAKTSPDAGAMSHKFDKAGNLRFSQDANQAAAGTVFFITYDFAGRPLVSGQGPATFSSLDPFTSASFESTTGNWLVVRQYDAKPTNVFPWSNFWTQINPLTLNNVAGRLAAVASKSNGAWQVTLFSYDVHGRVVRRNTYTQANSGTSVLTALNTVDTLQRDLRDAVTWRRATVGSSPFHHWHDYDNRGLLWMVFASTSSTKPSSPDVTYTYRPSGQIQDRQFAGGPLVPLRYTIREHLEKIGDPAGTTYSFSARYAYHPNGTVWEAEFYNAGSPATAKRYRYVFPTTSYDALNRLKSADFSFYSSGWQSTLAYDLANITYDVAGNLRSLRRYRQDATLIDRLGYFYPTSSNRLSLVSDTVGTTTETWDAESGSFTYDANGNLKTAPAPYSITAVTYDHQNLALSLTSNGVTSAYRYNEAGQRITKQVGTGNTDVYLLDGMTALGVFTVNGSGSVVASYFNVLAGDKVVGRQPSTGNRRYYHTDLLGSTRAVVEGAGVVESSDFDPWGLLMPGRTLAGPTKEGFTGKEQDAESGLDYFGARYYMPALARWMAVDPLAEKHPEWSPYNYVLNNPLVLFDPDGRQVSGVRGAAVDPAIRLPSPRPSRPWVPGELAARTAAGVAGAPVTRDLAASVTPGVSTAHDISIALGHNFATNEPVGTADRIWSVFGVLTPLSGAVLKRTVGGLGDLVVGRAGRAIRVGAETPGGFALSRDAATRLAGRLDGRLGLQQLDDIITSPNVRRFSDADNPSAVRIFDSSITQFGGQGLNVVINPTTRTVITVFPSSQDFMRNAQRFLEIAPR